MVEPISIEKGQKGVTAIRNIVDPEVVRLTLLMAREERAALTAKARGGGGRDSLTARERERFAVLGGAISRLNERGKDIGFASSQGIDVGVAREARSRVEAGARVAEVRKIEAEKQTFERVQGRLSAGVQRTRSGRSLIVSERPISDAGGLFSVLRESGAVADPGANLASLISRRGVGLGSESGVPDRLSAGVQRTRSGRSLIVLEGAKARDAGELFERLGAPKKKVIGQIDFGREKKLVVKRAGVLPELSLGRGGEELSRRSVITESIISVPSAGVAKFIGVPSEGVSFPASFSVVREEREDRPVRSVFTPIGEAFEKVNRLGIQESSKPRGPLGNIVRGVRGTGVALENVGGKIESGGASVLESFPLVTSAEREELRVQPDSIEKFKELGSQAAREVPSRFGALLLGTGQFVGEEGRIAQESPVTFGAGQAVLLGGVFGGVRKGLRLARESRFAARETVPGLLARGASGTALAAETAIGAGLGAAFVLQTKKSVSESARPGSEFARATNQLAGFVGGARLGSSAVGAAAKVPSALRSRIQLVNLEKKLAGQLVVQAGESVKTGSVPVSDGFLLRRPEIIQRGFDARIEKLRVEKAGIAAEIKQSQLIAEEFKLLSSKKRPNIEVFETAGVEGKAGILTRFRDESDADLAFILDKVTRKQQGAREIPGSLRGKDRSIFRNQQKLNELLKSERPGEIDAEIKGLFRERELEVLKAREFARKPVFEFQLKDRSLEKLRRELGVELLQQPIEAKVAVRESFERGGLKITESGEFEVLGKSRLVRPEETVGLEDFVLSKSLKRSREVLGVENIGALTAGPGALAQGLRISVREGFTPELKVGKLGELLGEPPVKGRSVISLEKSELGLSSRRSIQDVTIMKFSDVELSGVTDLVPGVPAAGAGVVKPRKIGFVPKRIEGSNLGELESVVRFKNPFSDKPVVQTPEALLFERGKSSLLVEKGTGAFKLLEFTEFRKFQRGLGGIPGRPVITEGVLPKEFRPDKKVLRVPGRITGVRKVEKPAEGSTLREKGIADTDTLVVSGGQVLIQKTLGVTEEKGVGKNEQVLETELAELTSEGQADALAGQKQRTKTDSGFGSNQFSAVSSVFARSIGRNDLASALRTKSGSKFDLKVAQSLKTESAEESVLEEVSALKSGTDLKQDSLLVQDTKVSQKLSQKLRSGARESLLQISGGSFAERFKRTRPKLLENTEIIKRPGLGLALSLPDNLGVPGFKVLVKSGGEFKLATTKILTRGQALELGATITDKNPAQQFKLLEAEEEAERGGREPSRFSLDRLLRKFTQKKGGVFQEKQSALIDTAGEVQQISLKGVRASAQSRKQLSRLGL